MYSSSQVQPLVERSLIFFLILCVPFSVGRRCTTHFPSGLTLWILNPRKSIPSFMWVIFVFSSDSSRCKELTFHDSGFEELPDKVNYVLVGDASLDKAQEFSMMYCIKVAPDVSLDDVVMFVTGVKEGHNDRYGIHGATTF